jgi:hypothetical protein
MDQVVAGQGGDWDTPWFRLASANMSIKVRKKGALASWGSLVAEVGAGTFPPWRPLVTLRKPWRFTATDPSGNWTIPWSRRVRIVFRMVTDVAVTPQQALFFPGVLYLTHYTKRPDLLVVPDRFVGFVDVAYLGLHADLLRSFGHFMRDAAPFLFYGDDVVPAGTIVLAPFSRDYVLEVLGWSRFSVPVDSYRSLSILKRLHQLADVGNDDR